VTKHDAGSVRSRRIAELEREYAELQLLCEEMWKEGLMTLSALSEGRDEAYRKIRDRMKSIKVAIDILEEMPNVGRPPANEWYDALALECLSNAGQVKRAARDLFIRRAIEERNIGGKAAENEWPQALRRLGLR
jgi:hypothetical protein